MLDHDAFEIQDETYFSQFPQQYRAVKNNKTSRLETGDGR